MGSGLGELGGVWVDVGSKGGPRTSTAEKDQGHRQQYNRSEDVNSSTVRTRAIARRDEGGAKREKGRRLI